MAIEKSTILTQPITSFTAATQQHHPGNIFLVSHPPSRSIPHFFNHVELVPRPAQRKPFDDGIVHIDRNCHHGKFTNAPSLHSSAEKPWRQGAWRHKKLALPQVSCT